MADKVLGSTAGSVGSVASPEETFESTGKLGEQDSAAIAQQELQKSRILAYIRHEDPFLSVPRDSRAAGEAASRRSMARTLQNFELLFDPGSRNRSPFEIESSSFRGNIVEATNTAVQNVQTGTQFSPITPLNVENRLLKPTEYFESLEELEREVQSSSLLDMLNVSFPVKIHMYRILI
jgi:hypothetical protein